MRKCLSSDILSVFTGSICYLWEVRIQGRPRRSVELTGIFLCLGSSSRYLSLEKHCTIFKSCLTSMQKLTADWKFVYWSIRSHVRGFLGTLNADAHTQSCSGLSVDEPLFRMQIICIRPISHPSLLCLCGK